MKLDLETAGDIATRVRDTLERCERVESADDCKRANDARTDLASMRKEVEDARKEAKAPVLQQGKIIDAMAKALLTPINDAIDRLDKARVAYTQAVEAERRRAIAVQQKAFELSTTVSLPPDLTQLPQIPEASPMRVRHLPGHVEVIDLDAIPREFMTPNMAAIKDAWLNGTPVPGTQMVRAVVPA